MIKYLYWGREELYRLLYAKDHLIIDELFNPHAVNVENSLLNTAENIYNQELMELFAQEEK